MKRLSQIFVNSMEQDGKGKRMSTWPQCMRDIQGGAECTATSSPALLVLQEAMRYHPLACS